MNCTLIPFAVLVAACLQQTVSLGPVSIPVATICLAALFAIDLFLLRTKTCPRPGTAHLALACAFALGILGLSRHEAASAAKELAQVAEALAVAWFLFARRSAKQRAALVRPVAVIAAGLLIVGLGHIYAPLTGLSDARRAAILAMALPALVLTLSRCPAALAGIGAVATGLLAGMTVDHGWHLLVISVVLVLAAASCELRKWLGGVLLVAMIAGALLRPARGSPWLELSPSYADGFTRRNFIDLQSAYQAPLLYPAGAGLGEYNRAVNALHTRTQLVAHPDNLTIPRDTSNTYAVVWVEVGMPAAALLLFCLVFVCVSRAKDETERIWWCAGIGLAAASVFATTLGRGVGIWFGAVLGLNEPEHRRGTHANLAFVLFPAAAAAVAFALMLKVNRAPDPVNHVSGLNQRLCELFEPAPKNGLRLPVVSFDLAETPPKIPVFEAESFTVDGGFTVARIPEASAKAALALPADADKRAGLARLSVESLEPGRYRVRARVRWQHGCANSLAFRLQGRQVLLASDRYEQWHILTSAGQLALTDPPAELILQSLEPGILIDFVELLKMEP